MYVLRTLGFLMLPKGERKMGILRIQDVIFSRLKIKHKFKKKGLEREQALFLFLRMVWLRSSEQIVFDAINVALHWFLAGPCGGNGTHMCAHVSCSTFFAMFFSIILGLIIVCTWHLCFRCFFNLLMVFWGKLPN